MVLMVKNLPTVQETQVQSLGQKDPVKKEMATHHSILAWRISWTESLTGYNPWGHKESDMTERVTHTRWMVIQCAMYTNFYKSS